MDSTGQLLSVSCCNEGVLLILSCACAGEKRPGQGTGGPQEEGEGGNESQLPSRKKYVGQGKGSIRQIFYNTSVLCYVYITLKPEVQ